jgi:hypothetical protein
MNFAKNVKGISRLLLILLLLAALLVGAILSYLWVIGYYINLGLRLPENPALSITNVSFNPQDTSYFTLTVLNPSYSPDASIAGIAALTEDGVLHAVTETIPTFPYTLPTAEETSFEGVWDWANYTGEIVRMVVFVEEGSGPIFEARTPLVDFEIMDVAFNSTIGVTHFNVTVQNNAPSVTYVNISEVIINGNYIPAENLSIPLPYHLDPNEAVSFKSAWNWTEYQDKNVTVAVHTLQGYAAYNTSLTPKPVILSITNILFDVHNTTRFNMTVQNLEDSPTYVNLTDITLTVENKTVTSPEVQVASPQQFPYSLDPNSNVTLRCAWNWTEYREKNVTVTVYTLQGFQVSSTQATTPRVIMSITNVLFDATDPSYLNLTVRALEFSVDEHVNITEVTVATENGPTENITIEPPITLYINETVSFTCSWDWSDHWNEKVSITVHSNGYSAAIPHVTPSPVMISNIAFSLNDTTRFNVVVENSEYFSTYVVITDVTAMTSTGTVQDITVIAPTGLPYVLHRSDSVVLVCSWNWVEYYDENITIILNTLRGYEARRTTVPVAIPVMIEVTNVLFDVADMAHFNVTVRNSDLSLEAANVTEITATFENATTLEIAEIAPTLPRMLSSNSSFNLRCSWDWTSYRDKNVTITVYTMQGHTAYRIEVTPDPAILIMSVQFPLANTTYFNITVTNSEYSIMQVNTTRISVTLQNGTSWNVNVEPPPPLPYILSPNESAEFKCLWNWTNYQGETVTVKVETLEGYEVSGQYDVPIP